MDAGNSDVKLSDGGSPAESATSENMEMENAENSAGNSGPELLPAAEEKIAWGVFGVFLVILFWGYLNVLTEAYFAWQGGLYSHGYLIPGIAAVLFWLRKQPIRKVPDFQRWVGVGLLVFSQVVRVYMCSYGTVDMWTFILAFLAIILIVGGFPMLRWAGPVGALLFFMFPLPWHWEQYILMPMQEFATYMSTNLLLVLGFSAMQAGNTIHLNQSQIGIVEQCSGLRMTTILLALSVSLVLLNERRHWENAVILIMAVPIALLTNIIRITVTAIAIAFFRSWEHTVHDIAGFCMVPLAIAFLVGLQAIMSSLFVEEDNYRTGNDVMESPQDVFWRDRKHIKD